jgi:hypothetical protein
MYKLVTAFTGLQSITIENEDGTTSFIPMDPANSDYQAYLAWVAEGNEAPVIEPEETE